MSTDRNKEIRQVLLEIIDEQNPKDPRMSNLQQSGIIRDASSRLGISRNVEDEQTLLTEWYELFRTGYMAWGHDVCNPNPPFCHVTRKGKRALEQISRDPSNPQGYENYLENKASLNDVASSYLNEALVCYNSGSYKAAAVMIGAASESVVLELRDEVVKQIKSNNGALPKNIDEWKIKSVINALQTFFDSKKKSFPSNLRESYEAYWAAFMQQIRAVRNEAGHPSSINPISEDSVHASFLIFPELASVAQELKQWVENNA